MNHIKINNIIKKSKTNGPDTRYTIWVQGCTLQCPGCINTDTWDKNLGYWVTFDELLKDIEQTKSDGITITGGEPLQQYETIYEFLKIVFPEYNIFLTSGYSFEKIKKDKNKILNVVDILCSGPFIQAQIDTTKSWRGSKNQLISFLTERGEQFKNYIPEWRTEIRIDKNSGNSQITGFTDVDNLVKQMLAK